MPEPTDAEQAAFEAGIKFGALYHQFAGTPVSPDSADSLATAMAESIENQPFCTNVEVHPHEDRIERAIAGLDPLDEESPTDSSSDAESAAGDATDEADYTELTGTLFDATIEIEREGVAVRAEMATAGDYPLMSLADVQRE
ncbi:dihydroneopterin aldolase family protein [Salinarchaeum laminariae]|uniref:dihydroneopterin aldolase family protein n=1 Tax=Salinarchaeum laminariae TaxID=869888 RepID=UPI0020BFF8F4|nr:dihydroneopterin aldolase family protein [Salinarchaeum laminariae]